MIKPAFNRSGDARSIKSSFVHPVSYRVIGADLPGAVGADAPIDGRLMGEPGAVHPQEKWKIFLV